MAISMEPHVNKPPVKCRGNCYPNPNPNHISSGTNKSLCRHCHSWITCKAKNWEYGVCRRLKSTPKIYLIFHSFFLFLKIKNIILIYRLTSKPRPKTHLKITSSSSCISTFSFKVKNVSSTTL